MTTFAYTVYHDEPEDAATNSATTHGFKSKASAKRAAVAAMDAYWNGGATVEKELFYPGEFGVRPDHYEFQDTLEYVGPGGVA